jgi:excinuclease UvrABC ATPase subunit
MRPAASDPYVRARDALVAFTTGRGPARLRRAFSPNTAAGACPRCHGLAEVHEVTGESLAPDPSLSVRDGAIASWPMDMVASADHVLDLGPGGGDDGGRVVARGTPAEVAASPAGRTAPYLRARLGRPAWTG